MREQDVVEQWRERGVVGPAVPAPPHASAQDRLLGIAGRAPNGPPAAP